MSSAANVLIHPSQFPDNVRRDLLASLRTRRVNHKFHYDSVKQTQRWLALHRAYSPTRNDADCRSIYGKGFAAAAAQIKTRRVDVIGLGCGGGQKDTRLLKLLKGRGKEILYTPCDVSAAMVLTARQTALTVLPEAKCFPLVCDLATADDLPAWIRIRPSTFAARLFTFFGMIPNFEPGEIVPKLASLAGPNDLLLFSANLAPGADYAAGLGKVLPQYDNDLTRDWLMAFLLDLGVERRDGHLRFAVEEGRFGLKRVVARFHFRRVCRIEPDGEAFSFKVGDSIQLFFSYRYTPDRVRKILARYNMQVSNQWIAKSGEEGVFLVNRSGVRAERR
ncbi:MAG TPA: L-histidine N(alpha)-methyltransferase [Candidatus Acidoferrales bacterium]|nr:L-histidine N(alpha)-methyltransferase [Candidatus Acidoferrales bacterium]